MSVLQRKARAGNEERQARSMTVPKSLRIGLAKVADDLFDLALAVIGVSRETWSGDGVSQQVEDGPLLVLLDGAHGSIGGAIIDAALVQALVQQQTMGKVFAAQESERRLTATDAALCAPLLDQLFKTANSLLEEEDDRRLLAPFAFGAHCENARLFALALDAPEYHVLRLTVDIAAGISQSTMTLILPEPEARPEVSDDPKNDEVAPHPRNLAKTVLALETELTAVLCRFTMPISQITSLAVGVTIPVHAEAFDEVELLTNEHRKIAKGAMGQVDGVRALMLQGVVGAHAVSLNDTGADASDLPVPASPEIALETTTPLSLDEPSVEDVPDLPDLPGFDDSDAAVTALEDLPDLPDLSDIPDLDEEFPALDDLPKLNIA